MSPRPLAPIPPQPAPRNESVGDISQRLANDPNVASFDVRVNKRTGTLEVNARHTDGRTIHFEEPVPGLTQTTRFDPNSVTIEQRNEAALHLLQEGLSQTDVGRRLGISQSRVSQISRNRSTK
ncbi:sigma factor-like helix-turn-helix DNA-binding protein [Herbaspirillum frisingense]|uniref:sigma factor-like helix-turn-helix DNA-binding protein n=1 Tax=Herbaspirillum frisingense TaxID=92645 RepID=UPI0035B55DEB